MRFFRCCDGRSHSSNPMRAIDVQSAGVGGNARSGRGTQNGRRSQQVEKARPSVVPRAFSPQA